MKRIEYYKTRNGHEPFRDWLSQLDVRTRYKIRAYVDRIAIGTSKKNIRALGDGIFEVKINYGPGYRVYFGEIKNVLIVLLIGGDKSTQFRDIWQAKNLWRDYVSK